MIQISVRKQQVDDVIHGRSELSLQVRKWQYVGTAESRNQDSYANILPPSHSRNEEPAN